MSLLAPAAAVALLALPAIALLYFLKVRREEVRVSSLMFWRPLTADRKADAPWQRLRGGLLLLTQLLLALVLAVALMRPGLIGAGGASGTTVVIIDASPSMEATDVSPSRFDAALRRAGELAGSLGPDRRMAVVLEGPHAQLLVPPTGDPAEVRRGLGRARPAGAAGDFGEAASLANSLLIGRPGGSIMLLGDGHMSLPASPPHLIAPFTYVSIGSTGENAGIESLAQPSPGTVYIRVANHGRAARDLTIAISAGGRLLDVLPAHVDGNSTADLTWNHLPAGTQVLEARLEPGDEFALDDAAWLVTQPPPPQNVLLVTTGNGFLEHALRLRPGLEVTTVTPKDYRAGAHDLYVFDGFVPAGPLPEPSLVIAPPAGAGPVPTGGQVQPGAVLPADPRDPLLRAVSLQDVHVQSAASVQAPDGWRPVIDAEAGPLLLVHDAVPRSAVLTFDLHHSDLPLRAAFPILVQNLLDRLLPSGFENQAFGPGGTVDLTPEAGTRQITVTLPDGEVRTVAPPFAPFSATDQLGVYTVRQEGTGGTRVSRFVVELQDPAQSRIGPGAAPPTEPAEAAVGPGPPVPLEIWPWLLGAAVALLAFEWVLYLGGLDLIRARRGWAR